ncbi:hypothetical protein TNCV_4698991 [Trichonephila clavipes]|nr:hypothetical protein TNCV_4698991 [Trichonephila clavipes]
MRETNCSHISYQVKEDDFDSPGAYRPGEIVLPKRILYYRICGNFGLRSDYEKFLSARRCDTTTALMQDDAPPHIARCEKQVLRCHFDEDRVICRHFRPAWPP